MFGQSYRCAQRRCPAAARPFTASHSPSGPSESIGRRAGVPSRWDRAAPACPCTISASPLLPAAVGAGSMLEQLGPGRLATPALCTRLQAPAARCPAPNPAGHSFTVCSSSAGSQPDTARRPQHLCQGTLLPPTGGAAAEQPC